MAFGRPVYLGDLLDIYAEKEIPPGSSFLGLSSYDREGFVCVIDHDSVTDITSCIDATCQTYSGGFLLAFVNMFVERIPGLL